MLYNESTGKPRTDILSLDSLIAWLETKPADETYDYTRSKKCVLQQYFTAMGLEGVAVIPYRYSVNRYLINETTHDLPEGWEKIALGPAIMYKVTPWTFGKALKRAKDLQKERAK